MTQDSKPVPSSEDLSRYRLAWAPRGHSPTSPSQDRAVQSGGIAVLQVWAPLIDFPWEGGDYPLRDGLRIVRQPRDFTWDAEGTRYFLSQEEQESARTTDHWIEIDQPAHDKTSAAEKINIFLVSLWIVRPSLTHVSLRFEQTPDGLKVFRVLERFQWIKDQLHPDVEGKHLASVRAMVPSLLRICEARGRLRNALSLTFRACISKDWQSSFVCFSAALEGLLNYDRGRGLTERLASTYAKLLARYGEGSNDDHHTFTRLYNVRSEIVHGRAYERESSTRNLVDLAGCSDLLRRVWRIVLEHDDVLERLEQDDSVRQDFFSRL
jgi:hypothetical protein